MKNGTEVARYDATRLQLFALSHMDGEYKPSSRHAFEGLKFITYLILVVSAVLFVLANLICIFDPAIEWDLSVFITAVPGALAMGYKRAVTTLSAQAYIGGYTARGAQADFIQLNEDAQDAFKPLMDKIIEADKGGNIPLHSTNRRAELIGQALDKQKKAALTSDDDTLDIWQAEVYLGLPTGSTKELT